MVVIDDHRNIIFEEPPFIILNIKLYPEIKTHHNK